MDMDKRFIALFAIILVLGTALRLSTLHFGTFMEPDVYGYYSVAQQTIANNLTITSQLSGFPLHNKFDEMPGLIYFAIAASYITGNLATAMLFLPVVFAIFEMAAAYMLAYKLSGSRNGGLVAMFLFATMSGAIFKNVAGEWRGESFVPLFAAAMLLALIYAHERRDKRIYALSAVPAAFCIWTWSGGVYAIAALLVFFVLWLLYTKKKSLVLPAVIGAVLLCIGFETFVYFENKGLYLVTNALTTIAELQPTTGTFLFLEFGLAIGLAPIGVVFYILKDKYLSNGVPDKKRNNGNFVFLIILSLFIVTAALQLAEIRYMTLIAMPVAVFASYALLEFYRTRGKTRMRLWVNIFIASIILVNVIVMFMQVTGYSTGDNISPQFVAAMSWVRNNTSPNATFLTDWDDGSIVEGLGQRQSYSDSLMGTNDGWQSFPQFLFAKEGNFSYLMQVKPDYLLVRQYWRYEIGAFEAEGGMANISINGTNFMALENGSIGLPIVYENNDTIIYNVSGIVDGKQSTR